MEYFYLAIHVSIFLGNIIKFIIPKKKSNLRSHHQVQSTHTQQKVSPLCLHIVVIQDSSENTPIAVLSASLQVWAFDPVIESLPIVDTNVHFARKQGLERYKFPSKHWTQHIFRQVSREPYRDSGDP